jgi:hypothetical protein
MRQAPPASATMVPPFALFEFNTFLFVQASWANNAKSGTCVIDASARLEQAHRNAKGGTYLAASATTSRICSATRSGW